MTDTPSVVDVQRCSSADLAADLVSLGGPSAVDQRRRTCLSVLEPASELVRRWQASPPPVPCKAIFCAPGPWIVRAPPSQPCDALLGRICDALSYAMRSVFCAPPQPLAVPVRPQPYDVFECPTPAMSLCRYVRGLVRNLHHAKKVLVATAAMVDRFLLMSPAFRPTATNAHKLFAAACVVTAKFWSDVYYSNSDYGRAAGLPIHKMK